MRYGALLSGALAFGLLSGAAPQDPKDIKAVMGVAHKGKDSLFEKIKGGKGTDDDNKKLLGLYQALAKFKPPMGDEKSWTDKTAAMVAAAQDLVDKKAGALDKLKTAVDCKACHTLHKPK
jgi:hypothetical protein